jgi:hypothetical protein
MASLPWNRFDLYTKIVVFAILSILVQLLVLKCTVMRFVFSILLLFFSFHSLAQYYGNYTPTYEELVSEYKELAEKHSELQLFNMGSSDFGTPIYLCVVNGGEDSTATFLKARNSTTLLINNGIHPGEPDGINASINWLYEWIASGKDTIGIPVVAIVLSYNVGGTHQRSSTSRANQNGPEEYGFRGNAQNLDLNRDFIKMDSKNSFTFATLFHALDPDVFIDTHVSNGADYQYVLTLISPVKERLSQGMQTLIYEKCIPSVQNDLKAINIDLFPYIELKEEIPDKGIVAFNDLPRYSMGYTGLFDCLSFTVETHMLKPFPERVLATQAYISSLIKWIHSEKIEIESNRIEARKKILEATFLPYNYQLTEDFTMLNFKGFEAKYKPSAVTGLNRLYYDRNQPFEKGIPYYNLHESQDSILIPKLYVIGKQCEGVLNRLKANQVELIEMEKDSLMQLEVCRIESFESKTKPYEGHFMHTQVYTQNEIQFVLVRKGDFIVSTSQDKRKFILNVLEPQLEDSYFRWNFFDSYLQQKEYFSPYVFEEKAFEILENNPELKKDFELKRKQDEAFDKNAWAQLYFIYKSSDYCEPNLYSLPIMKGF